MPHPAQLTAGITNLDPQIKVRRVPTRLD